MPCSAHPPPREITPLLENYRYMPNVYAQVRRWEDFLFLLRFRDSGIRDRGRASAAATRELVRRGLGSFAFVAYRTSDGFAVPSPKYIYSSSQRYLRRYINWHITAINSMPCSAHPPPPYLPDDTLPVLVFYFEFQLYSRLLAAGWEHVRTRPLLKHVVTTPG
ncbi:hypothetical protein Dda_8814 [Drechslerella dactyloides]|uniref:Uncharacterized protein n=1 Tax=Drechslerella dactyloides TaxID=74499 RepID=A0AAD6NEQ1_DREDA|nr:hypothetical protein Dda_8814 [Drechslerella dactyloides]